MGTYNSAVITNGGQSMIAQAVAGASLEFTTIKTSSYAYPAGTNLATLTTLNGIKQSKDITSATVYNSRVIKISAAVDNTDISTAYTINTIGIYAKVGSSAESLFAVVTASAADTMPAYDNKPYSYIYEINLTMQNAANVTVTVNTAGLVNVADLNAAKVEIQGEIADLKSDFKSVSESYENLYSLPLLRIGENWIGGSAADRAVAYIKVNPSTTYFVENPINNNISDTIVIEKERNSGSSPELQRTYISPGASTVITTTANTNFICVQFNGLSALSSSDFENYDFYVVEGSERKLTAVDKVAREEVTLNAETLDRITSYKKIDLTDYEIRGKYINDLGKEINSTNTYAITKPIPVTYGCHYSFVGTGITIISAICECDGNGIITKSVFRYAVNGKEESFDYIPEADGYVILSYDYVNDFAFNSVFYDSIADVNDKFNTERSHNLYNSNNVIVGKNWTDASASDRAVTYVKIKKSTKYIIDFCLTNPNIVQATIIEKNRISGGSLNIVHVKPGNSIEYTTSSSGNVICVQLEGKSDITSSQIKDVYLQIFESSRLHYVNKGINTYNTFREMVEVGEIAEGRIGEMVISPIVSNPEQKYQTQGASAYPYFDVNATLKQYNLLNGSKRIPNEYILNDLPQEEIDFTPTNAGFNRMIVFKDVDDRFFITNQASDRLGQFGDARYDVLEMTTDFKNFTTVLRCSDSPLSDGIPVPDMTYVKVTYMKQFADGSYILCINCKSLSDNKSETHFYKLSADLQTLIHCNYVNLDGNTVEMVDEFNNGGYDWSCYVTGSKALATTYGSRNPENDYGRVWYTEDNGEHWKQVFQTNTHLQEGGRDGVTVTKAHTHGVMIDPYTGRLFIIVGEDNDTVFWNDNGMDANNDNWQTIMLAKQSYYNFSDHIQAVNGYALENCLLLGSDNEGSGGIYRINKLKDGTYSKAEMAHEVLPNNFWGTFYCAGELSRRDLNSPLLMCITRENATGDESTNEQLNQQNLGRVIATYDGFNFTEIWKDDTYGAHDVYINNAIESRNFAYCTRGMNCWILKNGDAVIKYSGRDYYYFGATPLYSVRGFSNASNKVLWIRNADKYI